MRIGVLTDSTCDLGPDFLRERGIEMIPLIVHFNENEIYKDVIEIGQENFFRKQIQAEKLPTTSQPSIGWFVEKFKEMSEEYDAVICIHLAGVLSGTCEAARMAAKEVSSLKVEVIDSCSASFGIGFQALLAKELIDEGLELEEIVKRIKEVQKNIKIFFTVNDLTYLQKGGRIGKAQAFLGSALNFYPILNISEKNGEILPVKKVRGKKKIARKMYEMSALELKDWKEASLGFVHGLEMENFVVFKEELLNYLERNKIRYIERTGWISSVIGSHVGPSIYGVVIFKGDILDL